MEPRIIRIRQILRKEKPKLLKEYHGSTKIKRHGKMNLELEKLKGINFLFSVSVVIFESTLKSIEG